MAGNKRRPDRELNHENWNDEEEPEEGGVFQQAAPEVISTRKILRASRRLPNNEAAPAVNPFSSFAFGFGAPITASSSPPVVAPADSAAANSDDSNSGEASAHVGFGVVGHPPDANNEVDSSSSVPAHNNITPEGESAVDGQVTASSSSGLNDTSEAANTNGDLIHRPVNEEASSEADACSRDSLPENHSRHGGQDDDEIASSSNNADNEDSSNDHYYRDVTDEVGDSNSADVQDPTNDDSKNAEDVDSTV